MSVDIRRRLAAELASLVQGAGTDIERLLEIPPRPELGDFALPCFALAPRLKKNPAQIAQELARGIHAPATGGDASGDPSGGGSRATAEGTPAIITGASAQGPYLNLMVDKSLLIGEIVGQVNASGFSELADRGRGKTVLIDFSSPNIAKPFGIGHLRSTVIGNSLKRIYAFLGYRVVGINHLGDWGTQFGKLITAFLKWGRPEALDRDPIGYLYELYVRYHREAEQDPALDDEARAWFTRMEQGDPRALELWRSFSELSLREFQRIYDRLGVSFEAFTGESFYRDKLEQTLQEVERAGITRRSEGALVVPAEEEGQPPVLLRKRDGSTLYITRDLAAALYRHRTYRFNRALYVVGSPQALHFRQLFMVLKQMGLPWYRECHHVAFGQIRFKDGAMSTRRGNIVLLEEVLERATSLARDIIEEKNPSLQDKDRVAEAVGVGAVIFNDLKNYRIKDIMFDWDELMNFNGETGVYLQYTHARMRSLLKKYTGAYGPPESRPGLRYQDDETIYALAVQLNDFEDTVSRAAEEFEPSVISRYLLELAARFNAFYTTHRVITDDPGLSLQRALVVSAVVRVLGKGLELLGLNPVDEM
ncbi:MAG: arginine--tRNA ligase [Spirochaetota bacterium]